MLQCRHTMTVPCIERDNIHHCEKPCIKTYPCGHKCQKKCCEPCSSFCTVKIPKLLPCGHTVETECGKKQSEVQCNHVFIIYISIIINSLVINCLNVVILVKEHVIVVLKAEYTFLAKRIVRIY